MPDDDDNDQEGPSYKLFPAERYLSLVRAELTVNNATKHQ